MVYLTISDIWDFDRVTKARVIVCAVWVRAICVQGNVLRVRVSTNGIMPCVKLNSKAVTKALVTEAMARSADVARGRQLVCIVTNHEGKPIPTSTRTCVI